jgi:nitrogen-specific signal transduction histidine kinase/CheY-like chemotaxis protein
MRATLQTNETQRQKLEDHLRQSQKMEAIGRLAGGVAHDFNNLLTVIKGHSSLMLESLAPDDAMYSGSRQIEQAADRAASLTRQLLAFCRMQILQPKVLDLNALVSDMAKMLTRLVREDILFSFRPGASLGRVKADPGQLEQVIMNFTVNAGDAMPNGGALTIETQNVIVDAHVAKNRPMVPPGSYVMLIVSDTGCGMDAETKAHIFEPFFTTKELGKGTGLGLATVYGVIKQSGGWIWVDSTPGEGTRFEVYLPRVDSAVESTGLPQALVLAANRNETVLIAEDEDAVRDLASRFLKSAGYTVLAAKSGSDALEAAQRWGKTIDLLLTDMVMAHMRGPELAGELKNIYPDIKTVYMSGYHEFTGKNGEIEETGSFVQKPFARENLLRAIAQALNPHPNGRSEDVLAVQAASVPRKAKRRPERRRRAPLAV